jgi:O-antigen ligase
MTPKLRIRRRHSFPRHRATGTAGGHGALADLLTPFILAVLLVTGPLILGATRLWIELPLLSGAALLFMVQGLRLASKPLADESRRVDAIDLVVVFFLLYALVRWLTSPAEYLSRIEAMDIVAYAGVFLTSRYGMANRKHCMALLFSLAALGAAEMIFGYYLSNHPDWFPFGLSENAHVQYAPRWVGTYESPNHYASLLVMAMGAALALGSFSKLAWPARIIFFYAAVMMIVGVIYSGSRGSWIALVAAIAALVVMGIRNGTMRWWWPVSAALVLIAITIFLFCTSPVVQERLALTSNTPGGQVDTGSRIELAVDALRMARDHPIFGTGPGTFAFVHPHYQGRHFDFKAQMTHNDYLNCLDDYGLVGFALAFYFVGAVTLKFFRPLEVDNRWQDRVLVATGFAAWVALLVHSLFDFNLHIPANALLLFSLVGLGVGRIREEKVLHWSTFSLAPLGGWLGWGLVLMSLIYGMEVGRMALSDIAYEKALMSSDDEVPSDSIAAVKDALGYDPGDGSAWAFLGDLHRYQALQQKNSHDRLAEGQLALGAYEQALKANALDDTVHARLGLTLDLMRKYPEALPHYLETVTAQPYNGQFWFWLGNHYAVIGDAKEAAQAYAHMEYCFHPVEWKVQADKALQTLSNSGGVSPSASLPPPASPPAPVSAPVLLSAPPPAPPAQTPSPPDKPPNSP